MIYPFICPNCGNKVELSFSIKDYKSDGNICDKCGTEMKRDPKSYCCSYQAKCDGFYGKTSK